MMSKLPTSGSPINTFFFMTTMELYLIGSLLLITSIGVQSTLDSPGVTESKEQPKRQLIHLANSRQEVAAHTQHDGRLNAETGGNGGAFPQNIDLPPPWKKQRSQHLKSTDDSYTKGKLRLVKRDANEGLNDDEGSFPQNNDLPPPGQTNHLPPLTNGMSHTQAPSVDVTQRHTTDNINVSSIMGMSTLCLLSCIVISRFLSTIVST